MKVSLYLRKSRSDEELEKTGQFNTLSRHKDTLLKLANEMNLSVIKIYEEIVSGDSINQRPEMLTLLKDVSDNKYDAVLVMDIDRLGRGNMQEQGLILDTFKQSKTKIITPRKTYDLNNEFDEEYSEFEAFMARKELKIITRRMQRGRIKSIEEGNYLGTYAPFGYKIDGYGRNRKLIIDPVAADAVKTIFEMYANGFGGTKIANKLNHLGFKTSYNREFTSYAIINIIKNPVYTGKVTWKKKSYVKGDINKRRTVKLNDKDDWIIHEGKHDALISNDLFERCQKILKSKSHPPTKVRLTNPLAGLVFCGACGSSMHYRPYKKSEPYINCPYCNTYVSAKFRLIEKDILDTLETIMNEYNLAPIIEDSIIPDDMNSKAIQNLEHELEKINNQINNLHDLLEQKIYTIDVFISRQEILNDKKNKIIESINSLSVKNNEKTKKEIANEINTVLDAYRSSDNIEYKNQMLKTIIDKIIYVREKGTKPNEFKLSITLNI